MDENKQQSIPPAQSSLHELRTAHTSAAYLVPRLHALRDKNPNLKVLDVGCGSGTITTSLAALLPQGHVTGIDPNTSILPRARALAEQNGVKNTEFVEGSVFKLPFEDNTFDITCCHQVLIHIGNPWHALAEMLRVTKPGGIVAAREGDYESEIMFPQIPGLDKFHNLMAGCMKVGGGDPTAGRQLMNWALRAGVERDTINASFSTSSYITSAERETLVSGLNQQLRGGGLQAKALKFGLAKEEDCEDMAKALEEWMSRPDACLAMLHGQIIIDVQS